MAAPKRSAKAKKPSPVELALAPHGFPSAPGPGLCFLAEDDVRFAQGYPAMRVLVDEQLDPEQATVLAETAIDAIDPVLRIHVPREVARRYLLGYHDAMLLFTADEGGPPENVGLRSERAATMRSGRGIDAALLDETLERHGWEMGSDTYARWRMPEVLYLYEGFIGAEAVARSVTGFLVRAATDLARWGDVGKDPFRTNAAAHHVALALPWLLRRVPASVAAELRSVLAKLRHPDEIGDLDPRAYFGILRWIADPSAPPHSSCEHLRFAFGVLADDGAAVGGHVDRVPDALLWNVGRISWVLGTARLAGKIAVGGHDLPRLLDQVAPLRDPGVVRLVARIATQRAGKAAAGEWLRAHADYARPILESLAAVEDPKEKKAAAAALELCRGAPPQEATRVLGADELEAELRAIFGELGKHLAKAKGRAAKAAAIRDAYERYTEARSAAGDPIPEAYFTHAFGDFGLGEWAMLAAEVID